MVLRNNFGRNGLSKGKAHWCMMTTNLLWQKISPLISSYVISYSEGIASLLK